MCARVPLPVYAEDSQLGADFFTQVVVRREIEVAALQHGPALVDGPKRELELPRSRELPYEDAVEIAAESVRNYSSHRHPVTQHAQNERMLGAIGTPDGRRSSAAASSRFLKRMTVPHLGRPQGRQPHGETVTAARCRIPAALLLARGLHR